MTSIKSTIQKSLSKATGIKDLNLEFSSRPEFGDYTTNIAIQNKLNAKEIVEELQKDKSLTDLIEKIDVAGIGFINFHLSTKVLTTNLSQILEEKDNYGKAESGKGKKVIVEYSSPNIAKPFTIGHLRSTIIGDAIANLLEAAGWKVFRDNHLGDWGTQFGKQIYAIKTWGDEEQIDKSEKPVKELVKLYVKFHQEAEKDPTIEEEGRKWFKKLEDGDLEAKRLWQKCIDWSWKEFNQIYEELNVKFTENDGKGYGESYFEDKMQPVVAELEDKKLLQTGKEGAKLVFFPKDKYTPLMILKKDGATLYATRDLATDKWRKQKYNPDLIINEVGIEQSLYFKQIFEIEKILGWYKENQRVHVGHGLFRFKEGKMSTRKGNVIWLEDVLNEAKKRATILTAQKGIQGKTEWGNPDELIPRMIKKDTEFSGGARNKDVNSIAIGAIKYNDLRRDAKQDIVFDWDEVLNMQGNSGPYLQYTYARAKSVLSKSKIKNSLKIENWNLKIEEVSIVRHLIKFPETIEMSATAYAPNIVCEYLYNLASLYNTYYNKVKIIGSENEETGLAITSTVAQVLKNGLNLLGIETPEKM